MKYHINTGLEECRGWGASNSEPPLGPKYAEVSKFFKSFRVLKGACCLAMDGWPRYVRGGVGLHTTIAIVLICSCFCLTNDVTRSNFRTDVVEPNVIEISNAGENWCLHRWELLWEIKPDLREVVRKALRASMLSKAGELCDFLNTCWMGTPLCGCKALSVCTNVLGLRLTGWSWSWSIQGSIITFTETLKAKETVAIDFAKLPKNLARTSHES
jgi:hypothetical protein